LSDDRLDDRRADRLDLFGFFSGRAAARVARRTKRRAKIAAQIERNRRGEYTVPTWALAALLVAVIAAWVAIVALL